MGRPSALSQEELEVWISNDGLWMETIGSNYAQGMAQFQQIKSGITVQWPGAGQSASPTLHRPARNLDWNSAVTPLARVAGA
jgi:hypothetical protein